MGIFLIFLFLGLSPFIIAGLVYLIKLLIYVIRRPVIRKVREEADATYSAFLVELGDRRLKADKEINKYISKNTGRIDPNKLQMVVSQMKNQKDYLECSLASKYNITYWYSTGVISRQEYIRERLYNAGVAKPSFYVIDDIDLRGILSIAAWLIGGVGILTIGIIAGVENSSLITNKEKIEIDTTMNTLKVNYKILDSQEARGREDWAKAVVEHNNNVYTFDMKVKENQYKLNNGWVNWFNNPVWNTITITEVESLYIK